MIGNGGGAPGTIRASAFNTTSSVDYKKDITELKGVLAKTKRMKPISFRWKDDEHMGSRPQWSMSAEEVADLFPDAAIYTPDGKADGYNLESMLAIALASIKELSVEVDALRASLAPSATPPRHTD